MKAIVYEKYGSPDVLQLKEVDKPTPKAAEVLIRVHAASANALDWHFMRGKPFMARIGRGIFKPKKKTLGADFAGMVEAVGKNVLEFASGDEVFGDTYPDPGGFAEYIVLPESAVLTIKPKNATFEEAAAIPAAGVTALQALRDHGKIQAGQKVLIIGASGAVGTFTVQMAKAFGGDITAVCSTPNMQLVHELGAGKVIDYTKEDFTKNGQQYDLIIDNVSNRPVADLKRSLKPNSICVIVGFTTITLLLQHAILGALTSGSRKIFPMGSAKANKRDLNVLKEMFENRQIRALIEKTYTLSETAEAIRYLETGHARAKVVVTM